MIYGLSEIPSTEGTTLFELEKALLTNKTANRMLQSFTQGMLGQPQEVLISIARQCFSKMKMEDLGLDITKIASRADKDNPFDLFLNLLYASCLKEGECRLAFEIAKYALDQRMPTSFLVEGNLIEKQVPEHKQPWKVWEHEKGSLYEKAVAVGEYDLARTYLEAAGKVFFGAKHPKAKHEAFVKFTDQNLILLCEAVASERGLWKDEAKVSTFLQNSFDKLRHDETIDSFASFVKRLDWPIKIKFV